NQTFIKLQIIPILKLINGKDIRTVVAQDLASSLTIAINSGNLEADNKLISYLVSSKPDLFTKYKSFQLYTSKSPALPDGSIVLSTSNIEKTSLFARYDFITDIKDLPISNNLAILDEISIKNWVYLKSLKGKYKYFNQNLKDYLIKLNMNDNLLETVVLTMDYSIVNKSKIFNSHPQLRLGDKAYFTMYLFFGMLITSQELVNELTSYVPIKTKNISAYLQNVAKDLPEILNVRIKNRG
ncbi:32696_t:CDS:2, partial [Racocetra persica]